MSGEQVLFAPGRFPALPPSRQQGAPSHPAPRPLRPEVPPLPEVGVGASRNMAASTSAGVTRRRGRWGRGPCRQRGRGVRRGPGVGTEGALKRLKLAVEEFVQAASEGETPGGRAGPRTEGRVRPGERKSRRELRKEKRHLKKARRLQRSAGPVGGGGGGAGAAGDLRVEEAAEEGAWPPPARAPPPSKGLRPPRARDPRARPEARAPPAGTRPPAAAAAATAAARKRALLAANEEEDREIRKLERCLGLNKRKRKGDGSSVPLSFARDGLDYILGALESGKNNGLYESSSSGEEEEDTEEDAGPTLPESDLESDTEDEGPQEDVEEDENKLGTHSEEEDVKEEKQKKAEEGGATRQRDKKRVRFVEEKSEPSSSEDSDTAEQVLCEQPKFPGAFLEIRSGGKGGTDVLLIVESSVGKSGYLVHYVC